MNSDDGRSSRGDRRRGTGGHDRPGGRRSRHGALAVAVVIGAIEIVGAHIVGRHQTSAQPLDPLGYALLATAALALPFRLRWRVPAFVVTLATTVVYAVLGFPYGPVFLALLLSIFGAVRAGRRTAVRIGLAVGYAVFLTAGRLVPHLGQYTLRQPDLITAIQVLIWLAFALVIAEGIRVRSAHMAEIRRSIAEQARARAEQQRRQASEERLRIAQELHDVLGHHLSLISVQAGVGLHLMDDHPEEARAALEAIKQASTEALGEVRAVLAALRPREEPAPRTPAPSLADLAGLVDPARTVVTGVPRPLPPDVDRAAYRIIQESLTNVRRHAGLAAVATVTIAYGADRLAVEITDDGPGSGVPSPEQNEGSGIAGMRTRAQALGGDLTAGPAPGGGFRVHASLPVPAPPTGEAAS